MNMTIKRNHQPTSAQNPPKHPPIFINFQHLPTGTSRIPLIGRQSRCWKMWPCNCVLKCGWESSQSSCAMNFHLQPGENSVIHLDVIVGIVEILVRWKKRGIFFSWRDVEIDQAISKQQRSRSYKLTSLFYLPIINPMLQCSSIFTSVKFPFHTQLRPRVEWSSARYQMEEFSGVGEVTEFQASPEFTKQFVKYELKWQWYFSLKHKLCKKEGEKEAFVTQHRLQPKGLQNFNVILAIVLH